MQSTGEAMKIQMSTETKTLLETTGGGNFIIQPRYNVVATQIIDRLASSELCAASARPPLFKYNCYSVGL